MFRRQRNSQSEDQESNDNPFLLSYSDIMAGLLIVFILALILFMIQSQRNELDLEKKKIELIKKEKILTDALKLLEQWRLKIQITRTELQDSLRQIKGNQELVQNSLDSVGQKRGNLFTILQGIQGQLKIKGIDVEVAENGTVLRIPEKSLSFEGKVSLFLIFSSLPIKATANL